MLKMLNAQTQHSGHFGEKILFDLLFPVGVLDLVTSITEAESRAPPFYSLWVI
jgi:hypothetical protein